MGEKPRRRGAVRGPRRGRPVRREPEPAVIGETLDRYLEYLGAPPVRTLSSLEERWSEVVGPALADPTRPIELVDGVLVIGCEDATWASQVGWMENQIMTRFRVLFPGTEICRIKARIGR